MKSIEYTTVDDQIKKLLSQNLIIPNIDFAKSQLNLYGYSNLIKSYRFPYIIRENDAIKYRSGVTFNQILSLYLLDKNLRNAVMASMQDLEERIKEAAASVIAKSFTTDHNTYLKFSNYANRRKRKERFTLPYILTTLQNTLNTDKNPIHHYMEDYNNVPPWILFKSIYFSTIVNFIDLFKNPEKDCMVDCLYDNSNPMVSDYRLLLMDTLYICLDYRNMAAHGGRIYSHNSSHELRVDKIFNGNLPEIKGFSQLLFLLSLFEYGAPYERLAIALDKELNRHCSHFPQDVTYLGQILNINIEPKELVYVSPKSKIFHSDIHCCGLKNAAELELSKARELGYSPCKKCFR